MNVQAAAAVTYSRVEFHAYAIPIPWWLVVLAAGIVLCIAAVVAAVVMLATRKRK